MDAERTDEELVASVRQGDDRAFEALWQRYHRRIAAYVNGMVNDHARAEDIAQDVFMSALRRMRDTDRPIAFKPWIYEIAKNACIDAFRRSRRTEEVSYDADGGLGHSDQVRLVSSSPTPDVAVDTRMSLDNLRGAFGGLSETHHDILVMRELEGLSYREIGERMGMSRPSVESTLFRARRRLTEEYEELISGERCRRMQQLILDTAAATLGARDTRRMARHVSHCQPCRRAAGIAGIDVNELAPRRPLREKIAALIPLPAFLRRRISGADEGGAVVSAGQAHGAQWAATIVGQYVEPAALSGWAKAAAAAATIAVAGVGAGVATDPERAGFAGKDEKSSAGSGSGSDRTTATAATTSASAAAALPDGQASAIGARDRAPAATSRKQGSDRRSTGGDTGTAGKAPDTAGPVTTASAGDSVQQAAATVTPLRLGEDSGSGSGSSGQSGSGMVLPTGSPSAGAVAVPGSGADAPVSAPVASAPATAPEPAAAVAAQAAAGAAEGAVDSVTGG